MPRRLFAVFGILLTLLAFGAGDAFLLTKVLCDKNYVEAVLRRIVGRQIVIHRLRPVFFNGLAVSRLRLTSAQMPGAMAVFQIQEVAIRLDPAGLLRGRFSPVEVTLDSPELNMIPNRQGEYELASLFQNFGGGGGMPTGEAQPTPAYVVRNGLFRVQSDSVFEKDHIQEVRDVNVTLRPFKGSLALLEGSLLLVGVGRFEVTGEVDYARKAWSLVLSSPAGDPIVLGPQVAALLANTPEHPIRGSWNNYKPEGPVDLKVRIVHDPSQQPADDWVVIVDPHGINVTAKAFPLDVEDAEGHLEFRAKGALIMGMKCKSGPTDLRVDGYTDGYDADAGFHLVIDMTNLLLDHRLKKALHPDDQKTYDLFKPSGKADARAEIDRPFGKTETIRNHVWIRCKDAAFTYAHFPYPITGVAGEIELDGPRIDVKGVTGQNGLTTVTVKGTITDISGDSQIAMRIEGSKIHLDKQLHDALGKDAQKIWDRLAPDGEVNLDWSGDREKGSGKELAQRVAIGLNGVRVLYDGFPYELTDLHGEVVYDSAAQKVEIRGIDGRHVGAQTRVRGEVRDIGGDGAFELKVEGTDIALDADLKAALTPENREVWEMFHPEGKVDLTWEGRAVGGRNKDVRQSLWAKLKGCTATYVKIPLRIEGITGQITYDETGTRIDHLSGRRGDANVLLDGTVGCGDDPPFDVNVSVSDLPIAQDVLVALPESARNLLTESKARGSLNLKGRFEQKDDTGGKRRTLYSAEVRLNEVDLDLGTPLTKLEGRIALSGEVDAKRHVARGSADIGRVRVGGKLLTKVHGQFVYDQDRLLFQGIGGDAYGGRLGGNVKFDLPNSRFEADLTLDDLDLSTFARDTFVSDKEVTGTMDAHAVVVGKSTDRQTWTGTLDLDIQDGELWEVPLFYRMVSVLSLKDDRKGKFETGMVKSTIADGRFHVTKLDFESNNVKLVGDGTVGFDGTLNLRLNTHMKSVGMGPLDPLFSIFDPITKNLYAIKAEGTFQEPDMSLQPLPFLFGNGEDDKKKGKDDPKREK